METKYKEGDLVELRRYSNRWTILANPVAMELKEYPNGMSPVLHTNDGLNTKKETFQDFEGKAALIVKVEKNHLDQPTGYRVLIGEYTWFCKSIVAEKYFYPIGRKGDESRGFSSF